MDDKNKVSQEELAAEQVQLQEVKEEEVRASIISEYGFDETADSERIDKLTAKELEHRKKMSQAIGQKIKWRTEATKAKDTPPQPKQDGEKKFELSLKDTITLSKSNVHEDDIDEVIEYAKFKNIPIQEALKSTVVRATLAEKEEFRKSAQATTTGTARRTNSRPSDEEIMKKFQNGEVPKPGSEEAERLFWIRRGGKK